MGISTIGGAIRMIFAIYIVGYLVFLAFLTGIDQDFSKDNFILAIFWPLGLIILASGAVVYALYWCWSRCFLRGK